MTKLKCGDIFSVQLPNQKYISARVILDVYKQCYEKNKIEELSGLFFYQECILVEIYSELFDEPTPKQSSVLIPGIFFANDPERTSAWQLIGHQPINPLQVEFPETLPGVGAQDCLVRGEITLPLQRRKQRKYFPYGLPEILPSLISPKAIVNISLYYLNLKHLITTQYPEIHSLVDSDLRFSEHRSRVYQILDEEENQSYYEMSSKLGLDVTRFYE
ncbi:MAG: Imm26 family immunity protein [Prochloraceae cyanobacterium]